MKSLLIALLHMLELKILSMNHGMDTNYKICNCKTLNTKQSTVCHVKTIASLQINMPVHHIVIRVLCRLIALQEDFPDATKCDPPQSLQNQICYVSKAYCLGDNNISFTESNIALQLSNKDSSYTST